MPVDKRSDKEEILPNNDLPTLYVDGISISHRNDGVNYIRFVTSLPDGNFEQARFITTDDDLKEMTKIICGATNYYPRRPKTNNRKG